MPTRNDPRQIPQPVVPAATAETAEIEFPIGHIAFADKPQPQGIPRQVEDKGPAGTNRPGMIISGHPDLGKLVTPQSLQNRSHPGGMLDVPPAASSQQTHDFSIKPHRGDDEKQAAIGFASIDGKRLPRSNPRGQFVWVACKAELLCEQVFCSQRQDRERCLGCTEIRNQTDRAIPTGGNHARPPLTWGTVGRGVAVGQPHGLANPLRLAFSAHREATVFKTGDECCEQNTSVGRACPRIFGNQHLRLLARHARAHRLNRSNLELAHHLAVFPVAQPLMRREVDRRRDSSY